MKYLQVNNCRAAEFFHTFCSKVVTKLDYQLYNQVDIDCLFDIDIVLKLKLMKQLNRNIYGNISRSL